MGNEQEIKFIYVLKAAYLTPEEIEAFWAKRRRMHEAMLGAFRTPTDRFGEAGPLFIPCEHSRREGNAKRPLYCLDCDKNL